MAINLTTKYSPLIDERFKLQSITDKFSGKKYSWDGAKTVKVYSVDNVKLNDYDREVSANRFGTPSELGDTVSEYTITQDKAFTFIIDEGNSADQLNVKQCNEQLKSNWDEVCTPAIDKYRFGKWINGAGLAEINSTALTKASVVEAIMKASSAMSNALVPRANRACFIRESLYISVKLSSEILGIDFLGEKAIKNGVVGYLDGMAIVPVPDSYLPDGVNFIIKHRDATADPVKLKALRAHKNPAGIDGGLGECRFYHDSFVLGSKANGIFVHAKSGMLAAPTFTLSGTLAIASADGANIIFTTDGSNPKTSTTAQTYSAALSVSGLTGALVRAYAAKSGSINSAVSEYQL